MSTIVKNASLQTISALPLTAAAIDGQHTETLATANMARQVRAELSSILDLTIEQIEQLCRERMLLVQLYKQQLAAWRRIALNAAEAAEIDRLDRVIDAETAIVAEVLTIAKEIYNGADERPISKSPLELRLELQLGSGSERTPNQVRPSYRQRHGQVSR